MRSGVRFVVDGDVRTRLATLAERRATGRLHVRASAGGWIHVVDGRIAGAERAGHPRLLVAMAEAGLFTPEEWQVAVGAPTASKWTTLADGDPGRLDRFVAFARSFVDENLGMLVDPARTGRVSLAFAAGARLPFGPICTWAVEDLLRDLPPPSADRPRAPVDAAEFLELLEEACPTVRVVPGAGPASERRSAC